MKDGCESNCGGGDDSTGVGVVGEFNDLGVGDLGASNIVRSCLTLPLKEEPAVSKVLYHFFIDAAFRSAIGDEPKDFFENGAVEEWIVIDRLKNDGEFLVVIVVDGFVFEFSSMLAIN